MYTNSKAREQMINNLITDILHDVQYKKHLKILYDLENEENEEEVVYGW